MQTHSFFYCLKLWNKSTRAHFHLHILLLLGQNKVTLVALRFSHVSNQEKWDEQFTFRSLSRSWNISLSSSLVSAVLTICMVAEEQRVWGGGGGGEPVSQINTWHIITRGKDHLEWFLRLKRSPAATSRTSEWGFTAAVGPNVTHCAALHFKDAGRIMNKKPPHCPFFSSGSM